MTFLDRVTVTVNNRSVKQSNDIAFLVKATHFGTGRFDSWIDHRGQLLFVRKNVATHLSRRTIQIRAGKVASIIGVIDPRCAHIGNVNVKRRKFFPTRMPKETMYLAVGCVVVADDGPVLADAFGEGVLRTGVIKDGVLSLSDHKATKCGVWFLYSPDQISPIIEPQEGSALIASDVNNDRSLL